MRQLNEHRANFFRYFAVALLAWVSFDYFLALVMRVRASPDDAPLVLHVSSQVIVPIMGFTFAVFTERAATELKHRIEAIESYLNQEAAVLTMLLPKLDLLLRCCPEQRNDAFGYLESHIDRLLARLRGGEEWSSHVGVCHDDPADGLLTAVQAVEQSFVMNNDATSAQVSLLGGVIKLVREFVSLRAQRTTAEQTSLPSFHWASLLCFGATFALGFLWAAGGVQHAQRAGSVSPPGDASPSILATPPSQRRFFSQRSAEATAATGTRQLFESLFCSEIQDLPITTRAADEEAVNSAMRCKRLKLMWALLVLSQFLVLEMSIDMQNPYAGQYKVDDHGVLAAVFDGPLRAKLMKAWGRSN